MEAMTKTEQRMYELLLDGEYHTKAEMKQCIDDDMASDQALKAHLHRLRKKLPTSIELITMHNGQGIVYRLVRPINTSE